MLSFLCAVGLVLPLPAGSPPEVQAVVATNNQFALDLYNQVRSRHENVILSPYSVSKALAMAYAGARGDTAREMAAVLHVTLGQERHHRAFLAMRNVLNHASGNPRRGQRGVQLYLSANVWGQRGCTFQKDYLHLLRECYGAGLEEVDFQMSEEARKTINAWAGRQTAGKIPELFELGAFNPLTRLVLASAICFKGDWVHPFKTSDTSNEPFRTGAGPGVRVPLMSQTATFGYLEDDQVQALRLPYAGRDRAMLVLLPRDRDGLANLEKSLTAARLAAWAGQLGERDVEVWLPRFRLTGGCDLRDTLVSLGMRRAFCPAAADFGGMNGGREPLFISAAVHKAFIDVNEEGTEAAAATGVAMATLSAPLGRPVFRADHPFLFTIYDTRTGVILFLGRVVRP
jgi:serpin B